MLNKNLFTNFQGGAAAFHPPPSLGGCGKVPKVSNICKQDAFTLSEDFLILFAVFSESFFLCRLYFPSFTFRLWLIMAFQGAKSMINVHLIINEPDHKETQTSSKYKRNHVDHSTSCSLSRRRGPH